MQRHISHSLQCPREASELPICQTDDYLTDSAVMERFLEAFANSVQLGGFSGLSAWVVSICDGSF
jgi:hypothetical protein